MAVDKFATLVESWNHSNGRGGWNLNCVRAFNHWEVDLVANLLFVLRKERVSTELDSVTWKGQWTQPSQCAMLIKCWLLVLVLCFLLRAFGCLWSLLK